NFTIFEAVQKKQLILFFLTCFYSLLSLAREEAIVEGRVINELGQAVEAASISILGESGGSISDKNGEYSINVPANKNITLVVTHISYQRRQKRLLLTPNEVRRLVFSLQPSSIDINEVEVEEEQN